MVFSAFTIRGVPAEVVGLVVGLACVGCRDGAGSSDMSCEDMCSKAQDLSCPNAPTGDCPTACQRADALLRAASCTLHYDRWMWCAGTQSITSCDSLPGPCAGLLWSLDNCVRSYCTPQLTSGTSSCLDEADCTVVETGSVATVRCKNTALFWGMPDFQALRQGN